MVHWLDYKESIKVRQPTEFEGKVIEKLRIGCKLKVITFPIQCELSRKLLESHFELQPVAYNNSVKYMSKLNRVHSSRLKNFIITLFY